MKNMKKTELLAPAGDIDSVHAAVANGCDAVYVGGKSFSARNLASNFTDAEMEEIVDYCHLHGVKVYITANTLYTNEELPPLFAFLENMYRIGADAFIMQDFGAAMEAKKLFPDIEIHASTQMTIHDLSGVQYLESMGFSRITLSRELSLEEILHITQNTKMEVECFVHGALCVSYSGQCLMSSFIGKRSGNRGNCAQSCRQKYSLIGAGELVADGYLLSPKDLMSLKLVDKLAEAGVASLKIEGRMKSPEYVAQATRAYRERIDKLFGGDNTINPEAVKKTAQIFNRGGFTEGYLEKYAGSSMMSNLSPKPIGNYLGKVMNYDSRRAVAKIFVENELTPGDGIEIWTKREPHTGTNINKKATAGEIAEITVNGDIGAGDLVYKSYDKKLNDELKKTYEKDMRKIAVRGFVKAVEGEPLFLRLEYNGIKVEKQGAVVETAQKQPMTSEKIIDQLSKTGNTAFKIDYDDCETGDNIFVNLTGLNEIRREATEEMAQRILLGTKRASAHNKFFMATPPPIEQEQLLTAYVRNREQFNGIVNSKAVSRIYFEVTGAFVTNLDKYIKKCRENDIELFAAMPSIIGSTFEGYVSLFEKTEIDGYLLSNYGAIAAFDGTEKQIALDYTFNILNALTANYLRHGADSISYSAEATLKEIGKSSAKNGEVIIHGKLPLMTTKQCPIGLYAGKKESGKFCTLKNHATSYLLKDKMGAHFPVLTNCNECIAYILNGKPIFMLNKMKDLTESSIKYFRIMLSDETMGEAYETAVAYKAAIGKTDSEYIQSISAKMEDTGFTYGYFFSGFDTAKQKKDLNSLV